MSDDLSQDFEDHCWRHLIPENVRAIYTAYTRPLVIGPNPALLLVDFYKAVFAGGPVPIDEADRLHRGSLGERAWAVLPGTQRLVSAARAAGLPVIYTTGVRADYRVTKRREQEDADDGYDIQPELAPLPGDMIVRKQRASGFHGTPLSVNLRHLRIESLVVAGTTTSGCLRATVMDAQAHGFHVTLVEECTFDRFDLTHQVNLFDLHHKYADVMHLEQVLARLGQLAPRDEKAPAATAS